MESNAEKELKFSLCTNYSLLIHRLKEENKKLEMRPSIFAICICLLIPIFGQTEYGWDREIFWFFVILAIAIYFYYKFKYKNIIKSNLSAIERWNKDVKIQKEYVSFLYELELDYEKRTSNSFIERYKNQVGLGKSS
jgi:glucan phosphoethanolaminetransferase (alkaline phosphatase superfamily)